MDPNSGRLVFGSGWSVVESGGRSPLFFFGLVVGSFGIFIFFIFILVC